MDNQQQAEYFSKIYDESPEFHDYVSKEEYINEMLTKQSLGVDELPDRSLVGDAAHALWVGVTDQAPLTLWGAMRGGDVETPDQRSAINEFLTNRINENQEAMENDLPSLDEARGSVVRKGVREGLNSVPSSLAVAGAGAGAGFAAGTAASLTGPGALAAATAGAGATSYAIMYNSAKDQFMNELYDICVNQEGATSEEWDVIQDYVEDIAQRYGHEEAGPEAISAMVETALAGMPFGASKIVSKALKATKGKPSIIAKVLGKTGEEAGETVAKEGITGGVANALRNSGKFMGGVALTELPTETATQKWQSDEWAKLKGEEPTSWMDAFKEVAPATIVQSAFMGGGIATGRHIARKLSKGSSVNLLDEAKQTPTEEQKTPLGASQGQINAPVVPPETIERPTTEPFSPREQVATSNLGGPEPGIMPILPTALREQQEMQRRAPLQINTQSALPQEITQAPSYQGGVTQQAPVSTPQAPQANQPTPVAPPVQQQTPVVQQTPKPVVQPVQAQPTQEQSVATTPTAQPQEQVQDSSVALLKSLSDDDLEDVYQYAVATGNRQLVALAGTEIQSRTAPVQAPVETTPAPEPAVQPPAEKQLTNVKPDDVKTLSDEDLISVYKTNRGKAGPLFIKAALEINKRKIDPDATPAPTTQEVQEETSQDTSVEHSDQESQEELPPNEQDVDVAPVLNEEYSDDLKHVANLVLGDYVKPTDKEIRQAEKDLRELEVEYRKIQGKEGADMTPQERRTVDLYEESKENLDDMKSDIPLNAVRRKVLDVYENIQGNTLHAGDAKQLRGVLDEITRHLQAREAAKIESTPEAGTVKNMEPAIHEAMDKGLTMEQIEADPEEAGRRYGINLGKSPTRSKHYVVEGRTVSDKQLRDIVDKHKKASEAKWKKEATRDNAKAIAKQAADQGRDIVGEGAWDVYSIEDDNGAKNTLAVHTPTLTKYLFTEDDMQDVAPATKKVEPEAQNTSEGESNDIDDIFDEVVSERTQEKQPSKKASQDEDVDIDDIFDEVVSERTSEKPASKKTGKEKVQAIKKKAKSKAKSEAKPKKDMTKAGREKAKSKAQLQKEARDEAKKALDDAVSSIIDLMANKFKFSSQKKETANADGIDPAKWPKVKGFLLKAWDAYGRSVSGVSERERIKGFLNFVADSLPLEKFVALKPYVRRFHQEVIKNNDRTIPEDKETKSGNSKSKGRQTVSGTNGGTVVSKRPAGYGLRVVDQKNIPKPRDYVGSGKYEIDDNQRLAVNLIIERFTKEKNKKGVTPAGFGLFDGTGTGKTRTILVAAKEMVDRTGKPSLIITKNVNIVETSFNRDADVLGIKVGKLDSNAPIRIGTYEDLIERNVKGETRPANIKPDVFGTILCDEAHGLKNMDSKRTIAFEKLNPDNVVFATATPMDRPEAATYFMAKLSGENVEDVNKRMGFKAGWVLNEYTGESEYRVDPIEGYTWDQVYSNIIKMRAKLNKEGALIRREFPFWGELEADNADILTPQDKIDQATIYNYWQSKIDNAPRGKEAFRIIGRLHGQRLSNLSKWLELKKAKYIAEKVKQDIANGRSAIVMCDTVGDKGIFVEGLGKVNKDGKPMTKTTGFATELARLLDEAGIKYGKIYGAGSKAQVIKDFQDNKTQCVICSTKSGGTGVDLDDQIGNHPRTMYLSTVDWSGDNIDQTVGRVSRRNTQSPSKIVSVFAKDSFSDAHREKIAEKKLTALRAIQSGEDPDLGLLRTSNGTNGKIEEPDDLPGFKKANPFSSGRVPSTPGVPRNFHGFIRELKEAFGLGDTPYVMISKDDLLGGKLSDEELLPDAVIENSLGSTNMSHSRGQILRDCRSQFAAGDAAAIHGYFGIGNKSLSVIVVDPKNDPETYNTLGHEFGHSLEQYLFRKAPVATINAIMRAHKEWANEMSIKVNDGISVRDFMNDVRGPVGATIIVEHAREDGFAEESIKDVANKNQLSYFLSFPEWFADNTAKWLNTNKKALSLTDKFFKRVANALRKLAEIVTGKKNPSNPDKAVADFLDEHFKNFENKKLVGEIPEVQKMIGKIDKMTNAFSTEAFKASSKAAGKEQAFMKKWFNGSQPIDSLFSWPFKAFGLMDEKGRWRAGHRGSDVLKHLVTKAEVPEINTPILKNLKPFVELARQGLIDRYKLDKKYVQTAHASQAFGRKIMGKGMELVQNIEDMNLLPKEQELLVKILTGEEATKEEWENVSEPIRQAIDELGNLAVQYGLITKESQERNKGKYLHRSYMKYETADKDSLPSWMQDLMKSRQSKLIGSETKMRGHTLAFDFSRIAKAVGGKTIDQAVKEKSKVVIIAKKDKNGKVHKYDFIAPGDKMPDGWNLAGPSEAQSTYEVRFKKSKDKATLWRDWTPGERKANGEILDARYLVTRTFMLCAHDIATGKFYKDLVDLGDNYVRAQKDTDTEPSKYSLWAVANGDVEWVKVPDAKIGKSSAKKWGALAGKSVRAEIWRDLNELDRLQSRGFWQKFMTFWKLNKTARHPGVHLNQIMSNMLFMDLADVRFEDLYNAISVYHDVFVKKNKDNKIYKDARDHGAFGGGFIENEIVESTLRPIMDEILGSNTVSSSEQVREWAQKKFGNDRLAASLGLLTKLSCNAGNAVKKFDRKALQVYGLEDEVFRLATYLRKIDQGYSPLDAGRYAQDQFLNYDIRAPWINTLRRSVLPFASYSYRACPVIAKCLMERPWKLAKYFTLGYAFQTMAYAMAGADPDEEEKGLAEDISGRTWLGLPRLIRMPWNDDGRRVDLDVRRFIPLGDMFDLNQGNPVLPVPAPLIASGPLMLLGEFFLNRSAFTGQDIVNNITDTNGEKAKKWLDHVYKFVVPSPMGWYAGKVYGAMTGERDALGRDYSVPGALASSVGIKIKSRDIDEGKRWKAYDVRKELRELNKQLRTVNRDFVKKRFDKEKRAELANDIKEKRKRALKKLAEIR